MLLKRNKETGLIQSITTNELYFDLQKETQLYKLNFMRDLVDGKLINYGQSEYYLTLYRWEGSDYEKC